jgi:hypothetical protein
MLRKYKTHDRDYIYIYIYIYTHTETSVGNLKEEAHLKDLDVDRNIRLILR